jgi:predicted transcriptional regulator
MKSSATTQVQVAVLSGLSQGQISRFLSGDRGESIQHKTVVGLERACDVMQALAEKQSAA